MFDELKEECGVVGVIGDENAANLIFLSLYALQHRGQEASGIVTMSDDRVFKSHKDFGLVRDVFNQTAIKSLSGRLGIGHNRYSTQGGALLQNIQPFFFNTIIGGLAIAQNGNLTNASILRHELEKEGSVFQSTSDTEIFTHLLAKSRGEDILSRIVDAAKKVQGAYSLLLLSSDRLFAMRDPHGFRPLVIGKKGGAHIVASETCALDLIGAEYLREIHPGEIVEIRDNGDLKSYFPFEKKKSSFCAFEPIYFSRPDSFVFGRSVYDLRKLMGVELAKETHVDADVVVAVPDSGVPLAMGYASQASISLELGLVRNHYVGRTFIEPNQSIRDFGVKLKLNPVVSVLKDKRVIVVDDSLVRGTTAIKILRMVKKAGAKEVHIRFGAPPITHSCYFGVDTPTRANLIAAQKSINEIRDFIGATSVGFLSIDGLRRAIGECYCENFCYGCFNGKYSEEICEKIIEQPTDCNGGPGLISD